MAGQGIRSPVKHVEEWNSLIQINRWVIRGGIAFLVFAGGGLAA